MPVPRTLEGFDVTSAIGRMLDQPLLWWQAVGLFVEHFAHWENEWQDCIGDDEREQKRVHALRSAAANVGAVALSRDASALEEALLKKRMVQTAAIPDSLRQHLRESYRMAWQSAAKAWHAAAPDAGGQGE